MSVNIDIHLTWRSDGVRRRRALRGVSRDVDFVIPPLAAHVRKAPAAAGL
ncbi:hypothetical protein [Streptomyces sp. PKU-EA00015]|nr:hypothetical protein [Streptomyces sp. PKU-EA00015]